MSQIRVNELTFYYDSSYDNIFDQVSFEIDSDWKLGFIGRNGRGKTTFLNLLMGKYEYRGNIQSSIPFDYFPYQIKEEEKRKNTLEVIESIDPGYELWMVCRELSLLKMDAEILYRPFNTLSNGEQTKVMLAVLFSKDNHFLLIDEPTNHLDIEGRNLIKDYLNQKKGFILVSHDRWFLDSCIDHVLALNKNDITVAQGNFTQWWENKQRQDEYELAENEKLKKEIGRMKRSAAQASSWADKSEDSKIGRKPVVHEKNIGLRSYIGEKTRRMEKRRKNLERRQQNAIEEKSGLLKNIEQANDLKLIPLYHHKETIVYAKDLSLYYESKAVVENLSFDLKNGECIVLSGKNGCGKSTVLKKIMGEPVESKGTLDLPAQIKISYVAQDTSFLKGSLNDFIRKSNIEERLFKTLLRKLDFSRVQFEKPMEDYSSGQKKKVLIARSLCEQAHLYIWDEPLNYIDIFSRMQVEELIQHFRPTLLMVEHDRTFVDNIADHVIRM